MDTDTNLPELEWHVSKLGKIVCNLHSLEFLLRATVGVANGEQLRFAGYTEGDVVAEDAFTNYDTLGALIAKYNRVAQANEQLEANAIVQLRDVIAHGRVSTATRMPMEILKFGRPSAGRVSVEYVATMDSAWMTTGVRLARDSLLLVQKAYQRLTDGGAG